jgi:hypothetical protein
MVLAVRLREHSWLVIIGCEQAIKKTKRLPAGSRLVLIP